MYQLINVVDYPDGLDAAARHIHSKWGNRNNFVAYRDCIISSSKTPESLPRFYLALKGREIVGCFALLINDLNSRQDLCPWLACVFVEEKERGNKLCAQMFELAKQDASRMGYEVLYLITDHTSLYERFGWKWFADGYDFGGKKSRIYRIRSNQT